ncbi:Aminoglycoside phosphotransferase [Penicillium coprophilum]|uniref:Aminoglycoside phosphotransferase n=1 Tax=Penicillium coprophilum TaxID=36646 RepID=UPI00238CF937|nr:Aminoglycoside phosphotransferase [Penicillium coprophilum]KAJ5158861.1 Aminoglycoside phosphotransferase [Penicillium coprophilum]
MQSLDLQELQFHGLAWEQGTFGLEPRWTLEPEIGAIKQTVQSLQPSSTVEVTFLTQGGFNKIYNVSIDDEMFIMRVALPVDPRYKLISEVATMDWVRRITNLPIPRVITYQSSRENRIGFEWMLMTKMPGKPFGDIWPSLSFAVKSRLVREFAVSSACIFRNQLQGIGNIDEGLTSTKQSLLRRGLVDTEISAPGKGSGLDDCSTPTGEKEGASPDIGRIVSMQFFWGPSIHQDIHRGPFRSGKDWIAARLTLNENICHSTLDKYSAADLDSDAEEEMEDATTTLQIIHDLRTILPIVFPTDEDDNLEPSMIFHQDLSRHNILVDKDGELTGVLDWECVSALPLWKGCTYPSFLDQRPRYSEPDIGNYDREANGELDELYFAHLWEYEATLLRDIFLHEMQNLDAEWMEVFDRSLVKRDLDFAVYHCDSGIYAGKINAWIEDITAGVRNPRSLRDRIYAPRGQQTVVEQ